MRPLILVLFAAAFAAAQPDRTEPVVSPDIQPDGSVTFRLLAPQAREVVLRILVDPDFQNHPMVKDDKGVWSVKVGPFEPGLMEYSFLLEGVSIIDPSNPLKKQGARGAGSSQLVIPGDPPRMWEMRASIPHGAVHVHWYRSPSWNVMRRFHVYTPAGYETGRSRYPVLYLLHGSGDTDREWTETGKANLILDTLIAQERARPMIVVMPDGHGPGAPARSGIERQRQAVLFDRDITQGVMAEVERLYRTDNSREARAIAGLSMGGWQALDIGLNHLDLFSHIGVFSMGLRGSEDEFIADHERAFASGEETKRDLKLFWIACGEKDFLFGAAQRLDALLTKSGIRHTFRKTSGGHVWSNWAKYLGEFAPQLFR